MNAFKGKNQHKLANLSNNHFLTVTNSLWQKKFPEQEKNQSKFKGRAKN